MTLRSLGCGLALALLAVGCKGSAPVQSSLSVVFVSPTDGEVFNIGDDQDPTHPGIQRDIVVKATDSAGRAITLESATLQTAVEGAPAFVNGPAAVLNAAKATFPDTLLPTGKTLLRVVVVEKGNKRQANATMVVQATPARPTVTGVAIDNDANSDFRLNLAEQSSGAPTAVVSTTGVEDGQTVTVQDATTGTVYGTALASADSASVSLDQLPDFTDSTYSLVVSVSDVAGVSNNITASSPSDPINTDAFFSLMLDRVVPTVTLDALAKSTFLMSDDADPGTPGFQLHVSGTASSLVGSNGVQLTLTPPSGGAETDVTPTSGSFSTLLTPAVGNASVAFTLTAVAVDVAGNVSDPAQRTFTVDLTAPVISSVLVTGGTAGSPAATTLFDGGAPNLFVTTADNWRYYPFTQGYIADANPGSAGGQLSISATVTGGVGGTFSATFGGSALAGSPVSITTDPQTVSFPGLTLADGASGDLALVASGANGNAGTATFHTTVDVTAPNAPTLGTPALVPNTQRLPQVVVPWSDASPGETLSGFDLRWTTELAVSGGVATSADFFNTTFSKQATGALLSAGATTVTLDRTSPGSAVTPMNTYWFQIRAVDAVGNESPVGTAKSVTNGWDAGIYTNPNGSTSAWGFTNLAAGDLNGDGRADIVISDYTASVVNIYYGQADLTSLTPQTLSGLSDAFGQDFGVGRVVGKTATSSDLVVSAWEVNAFAGHVLIYEGVSSGQISTTPLVEIQGAAAGAFFGYGAHVIGDINNDGLADIVVSAIGEGSTAGDGKAYLFLGRTESGWQTLAGGGSPPYVISATQADRTFDSPAPTDPYVFSSGHGVISVGDLDGDGKAELTLTQPGDDDNLLWILPGSAASGAEVTDLSTLQIQQLTAIDGAGGNHDAEGYGEAAFGGGSFVGGSAPDLVVTYPDFGHVHIYADGTATGFSTTPTETIHGPSHFGWDVTGTDLNGDGSVDLVIGQEWTNANPPAAAWLFYNHGGSKPFDPETNDGTTGHASGVDQSKLIPTGSPAASSLGKSIAVGDFNGDGKPDIAVADYKDSPAKLYIWY